MQKVSPRPVHLVTWVLLCVSLALLLPGCMPEFLFRPNPAPINTVAAIKKATATATRVSAERTTALPSPTRLVRYTATSPATFTPRPTATPLPPSATPPPPPPTPAFEAQQAANVRLGPGTNYPVVGHLDANDVLPATAVSPDDNWVAIDYHGKVAWVARQLGSVNVQDMAPAAAAAIPPTPLPSPTPRPTATATNTPTAVPSPTLVPSPTPTPWGGFPRAIVVKCEPSTEGTFFHGWVYDHGQLANGFRVVFSDQPGGHLASAPAITGPHQGWPDWQQGYYRHVIGKPPELVEGTWYVWVVDEKGNRISEFAAWRSTKTPGCNEATIDFER